MNVNDASLKIAPPLRRRHGMMLQVLQDMHNGFGKDLILAVLDEHLPQALTFIKSHLVALYKLEDLADAMYSRLEILHRVVVKRLL